MSNQNFYNENKYETHKQFDSLSNSAHALFLTPLTQPYETKSHEYYKSQITQRKTYECDENGELHIRIETLPNERPLTPVSPVIDYEIDVKEKPIYSNPIKFKPELKTQGILRSSSYLTNESSKHTKIHPFNKFRQNEIQKQNFINNNHTSNYSPRYKRRYERSRTLSPQCEMYQNRKYEKNCNVEVDSSNILDSERSSAESSFSPLLSNGSMPQFSTNKPIKKITLKSRLVSAYDGRPLTPFVTKVYYEDVNSTNENKNICFEKFKSWKTNNEQEENDTWDITLNPLFIH